MISNLPVFADDESITSKIPISILIPEMLVVESALLVTVYPFKSILSFLFVETCANPVFVVSLVTLISEYVPESKVSAVEAALIAALRVS